MCIRDRASPYLHLDDFLMLGLAGWLILNTKTAPWAWAFVLGLVIAVEGEPIWGVVPVIAGEILALLLISVAALKAHDRDPKHDQPEGGHDAHLQRDGKKLPSDGQSKPVDERVRQA